MKVNYDRKKLNSIISDFANIAGLSIAIYDTELNSVVVYKNKDSIGDFCRSLQKSEKGHSLCICSDRELLLKCRKSGHFVTHTCHAGLTDAVMPIMQSGTILGYIMLGRLKVEPDFKKIRNRISWYHDTDSLREYYSIITDYDMKKVKSIANIASIIVAHILLEDMIKKAYSPTTEQIVKYISENISGKLSVSSICHAVNISKNCLYENMRIDLNSTVNDYITDSRVNKAKELLLETDLPVYEIAECVGISNYPYFCRLFKEKTDFTPLKYRKRQIL